MTHARPLDPPRRPVRLAPARLPDRAPDSLWIRMVERWRQQPAPRDDDLRPR